MTAEVAIANAGAIALAADSAVTIGQQKIYNSALKLFALSKVAPVGIMIYGNASLLDVPWEILIKSYREKIASKKYPYLFDYAKGFIKYLNSHPTAFPESSQEDWLKSNTKAYFVYMRDEFFDELHPILKSQGEVESEKLTQILSDIIKKHYEVLLNKDYADEMGAKLFRLIRKKHQPIFKQVREDVFEKIRISPAITAKLYDIAALLQVKQKFTNSVSGIVVAGYGEKELYPNIVTYEIDGVFERQLKYRQNMEKCHSITAGGECRIIAFAQEDMVSTFMNGINPNILNLLHGYLTQLFNRLPELLASQDIEVSSLKKLKTNSDKLLKLFFEEMLSHIKDDYQHPVLRMVTALPKDELAAMAEALVNLTAFRRRMTESMETVGGPIDVAVISKGDGLVWVKRKHYFPPELNQHFFKNYFRGIRDDK